MTANTQLRNFHKGFTLIELLVAIAIIGLLSTIVFVSLSSARAKARDTSRLSDVNQLVKVVEVYATEHSNYPRTCKTSGSCINRCSGFSNLVLYRGACYSNSTADCWVGELCGEGPDGEVYSSKLPKEQLQDDHPGLAYKYTVNIFHSCPSGILGNYLIDYYLETGAGGLGTDLGVTEINGLSVHHWQYTNSISCS